MVGAVLAGGRAFCSTAPTPAHYGGRSHSWEHVAADWMKQGDTSWSTNQPQLLCPAYFVAPPPSFLVALLLPDGVEETSVLLPVLSLAQFSLIERSMA